MGEVTKIEWTDHTFNPWRGCTKIADGCANCYAARSAKRKPGTLGIWGDEGTRVVAASDMWKQPLKWQREAKAAGVRRRVFCASLADVFEDWTGEIHDHNRTRLWMPYNPAVGEEFIPETPQKSFAGCHPVRMNDLRARLFNLIDSTPDLDWLLLTKRPGNILKMWAPTSWGGRCASFPDCTHPDCRAGMHRPNVWLGTSVASQKDEANIAELLKCRDLAPVLFASYEPAIGPFDFTRVRYDGFVEIDALIGTHGAYRPHGVRNGSLGWIIVGGESGPYARPFRVKWARSTVRQCAAAGIACFVKQLGSRPVATCHDCAGTPKPKSIIKEVGGSGTKLEVCGCFTCLDTGSLAIELQHPKGGDWDEWPADLRVRQFPGISP